MILLMSLKKDPRQAEGEVHYMQVNPIVGNTYVPKSNQTSRSSVNGFMSTMAKAAGESSSYKVYLKKDDMLYSGGNGTGLSFYLKYAEDSTADNPKVVARGVDENGKEFEQTINVKDVNPQNATVVEMHALEAVSGAPKRNGLTSLPMGSENVGLNQRQDFMAAFKKNIADMNLLGEYGIAQEYGKLLHFYEKFEDAGFSKTNQDNITGVSSTAFSSNNVLKDIITLGNDIKTVNASEFKEVQSANYKLVPESDVGALRIYVDGESAGLFFPENMTIQEDPTTGLKVLVGEIPGVKDSWYDAIPVTDELEKALTEAIGVEEIPHKKLEGYYIGTHEGTGIRYLMRPGDEGRGGKVLLCNAADEARYKALGEEYAKKYPNLVTSQEAGLFYASLEIRGMAHRGENGIVMTHPGNISYNDNDDAKKNWSAKIDERTWELMLGWFENHRLNTEEMTMFKYWDDLINKIGGSYERIWSDEEERQGYLYQ